MARGESPYERDTYRYSPLIAAALLPNVAVHPVWGKVLFCGGDLLAGWLIGRVLRLRGRGLHSFQFPLNLSLLCPIPLNLSLLCPPYRPN